MNYNPIISNQGNGGGDTAIASSHFNPPAMQGQPSGYFDPRMHDQEESSFELIKIFYYFLKHRWLILCFLLVGLIAGTLFTYLQTPKYRAFTQVEIITQGARVFQDFELLAQSDDKRAFETAKQKMLSRELARRVVFELDLANNSEFLAPTPVFSLGNIFTRVFGTTNKFDLNDLDAERRQDLATRIVKGNIGVSIVRNTSILSVSYSHPSPKLARDVANQVTKSYIEQNVDKKSETSELARQFIVNQVQETKEKLQKSEKDLVDYAQSAGITVTGDEKSLIQRNISDINSALTEALQESLAARRAVQQVKDGNAGALPEVLESDSIQSTKIRIAERKAEYQQKLSTLKPAFPEMVRLRAEIREMEKQIRQEVGALSQSMLIKLEQAQLKESELRKNLAGLEEEQSAFQKKNIQYTILKREVDSNRTQYDNLIGKLNEVGIGSEIKSVNAAIIDRAILPGSPYSPKLSINLIFSVFAFMALAAAIVYVIELLSNTFATPDQIEEELKIPLLGIIPLVADPQEALPTSPISEAYRTLRTSVQFTGSDKTLRTLMVTSSEPSEAKTTTVFKLAEGYAALGKSVLVIDSDLRKPRMHKVFDTENGMGLSNLLTNVIRQDKVVDIFRETSNPNISFLSAGTIPPNPTDLLMSNKMGLTLHFCSKKYDLVIIDSPPVMGLSDAPILSRLVDATLFVVSSKQVPRKSAKNAVSRLRAVGANLIGVAFTKFDINKIGYEYGYKYMQNNYYTYGEEQPQEKLLASTGSVDNLDVDKWKGNASGSSKLFSFLNKITKKAS